MYKQPYFTQSQCNKRFEFSSWHKYSSCLPLYSSMYARNLEHVSKYFS